MIERKLIVGRYIHRPTPQLTRIVYAPGDFVTQPAMPLQIEESSGFFKKVSESTAGTNAKAHRNYQWLGWYSTGISEVPFNGVDVLTGPMSGCWLVTYRRNGRIHASHIGTDTNRVPETQTLKQRWNQWAMINTHLVVGGFNPARYWTQHGAPPQKAASGDTRGRIEGVMTVEGRFFSLYLYQQQDPVTRHSLPGMYRIAGIAEMPSASKYELCHI